VSYTEKELLTTGTNFTTSKTINLATGGGTLATVGRGSATYGGTIGGTGPLNIGDPANGGTVILTANNSYSGGTSIDRGTLQLGNGGTSGSITGNVTDNGTLIFDRSDAVTFGGVISGTGTVQQNGTGTTVLAGTNTYSGGTNIASGTLVAGSGTPFGSGPIQISGNTSLLEIPNDVTVTAGATNMIAGTVDVNGTFNVPSVSVQPGATLMGSGLINSSVTNSGTVSPGNSPGTLTIRGNYTQSSSGVLNIVINSATNYSRLAVTGHANLDGTLRLTLASGFRPNASDNFHVLSAGQGISGSFRSIVDPSGPPFQVSYTNGAVNLTTADPQKSDTAFTPSDGTPSSTTALISNQIFFNNLGSLAGRDPAGTDRSGANQNNAIGLTFDGGEFRFEGQTGHTYGFPIAGQYKFSDRVALDYDIPFEYVELPGSNFLQTGAILSLPMRVVLANDKQPFSWGVTPSAAVASTGSKEITRAGAFSNVLSYRWRDITLTYGNYISFFEGATLVSNDPQFPRGTSQQIMKNGLKASIPLGKDWLFEAYGIYTNFFESAPVSSYYTIGAELGRHITYNSGGRTFDLGYYSVGFYTEQGNHYSSGHIQLGTAWKF
jgi:autotransporter-associated beta strand protein